METYMIGGPDGPVFLTIEGEQYVVAVWGQKVTAGGSPLVVRPDPPIGPIGVLNLGTLYSTLVALLANQG